MIPKTIHACWFGGGKQSGLIQDCIRSWHDLLPDFEIRVWSEADVGIDDPYFHALLKKKKWAFASDYARFWLLGRYGGIWLDTDVEIVRSFTPLLDCDFFAGYESAQHIAGGVIGAAAGHPICEKVLKSMSEAYERGAAPSNLPKIITEVIEQGIPSEIVVYPPEYFYPYNPYDIDAKREQLMLRDITSNTYAIHHWAATWTKEESRLSSRLSRKLGLYWLLG